LVHITHYTSPNYMDHPQVNIPWIHCRPIANFFTVQDFWATYAFPEKQSLPWSFHSVVNVFFTIKDFWTTLRFPWKNRVFPEIFHCTEYIFYHSRFLRNFAVALRNRVYPELTVLNIYFLSFRIFEATCACPGNRVCPENFRAGGGCHTPDPTPRTPMTGRDVISSVGVAAAA